MAKSLIPLSGLLLTLQGVAEVLRCIVCIKTGNWASREIDSEETEKILMITPIQNLIKNNKNVWILYT